MPRIFLSLIVLAFLGLASGCGESGKVIDAETLANAQGSYDKAVDQIEAGDTDAALANLDLALQPGAGLPADIYVDARIRRAICLAKVDRIADAHADLDNAAEGAGDMSAVYAVRSYVFSKEGKKAESKSAFRDAQKLNRSVKRIRD